VFLFSIALFLVQAGHCAALDGTIRVIVRSRHLSTAAIGKTAGDQPEQSAVHLHFTRGAKGQVSKDDLQ
jgi:hypothetical protein